MGMRPPVIFRGRDSLGRAILALLAGWNVLLLGGLAASFVGERLALLASFGAAALLLLTTRPRSASPMRLRPRVLVAGALGLVAGYASLPFWIALIVSLGSALGLEPTGVAPLGRSGAARWVVGLVLAPVFEELLYRERLLPPLRRALGVAPALVLTSLLFALPHLEPWAVLGTFVVGLGLGSLLLAGGSVVACIGLHAGLNLAALLWASERA
jgi:membrane protease YdiL (CAAX protease family)